MLEFLRKYNAVPANNAGPQWSQASEEALLGWFASYAAICRCGWNQGARRDATPQERAAVLPMYNEIVAEIDTRARRPNASPGIVAAHFRSRLPTRR